MGDGRDARRALRVVSASIVAGLLGVHAAAARDLIATRPGVMCRTLDALTRLTLDDGSDRTIAPHQREDDVVKSAGGCIDFPAGARVRVVTENVGTSRVVAAIAGVDQTLLVANSDFRPDLPPEAAAVPAVAADAAPEAAPAPIPVPAPEPQQVPQPTAAPAEGGGTPETSAPSVTGLELGMAVGDVESALGKGFVFANVGTLGDRNLQQVRATGRDRQNQYLLGFFRHRLWFVDHLIIFPAQHQPELDPLEAELTQKYGAPTAAAATAAGYGAQWQYDADGQLQSAANDACTADLASVLPLQAVGQPQMQSRLRSDCVTEVAVMARLSPGSASRLAQFQVVLTDPAPVAAGRK